MSFYNFLIRNMVAMIILNKLLLGLPLRIFCLFNRQAHDAVANRKLFFQRAFSALAYNGITGDYAEFGCYGGLTVRLAYEQSKKCGTAPNFWCFDSFCGLPEKTAAQDDHPRWEKGAMAMSTEDFKKICFFNGVPSSRLKLVPGFYEQSLRDSKNIFPENISLVYIDCDLYSSTRSCLEFLSQRLKHGMILAFDDYYCWSATQVSGERKACADFFKNNPQWDLVPFVQFGWHGMSFLIEGKDLAGSSGSHY